jgi:hypothetical protein
MKRDRFNITIYRGETFTLAVELDDNTGAAINLTGATITAQCKVKSTNTTLFSFNTAITAPATDGKFTLSVPAGTSSPLTPQKGLIYDVKIAWAGGDTKYWLGGDVEIVDTVTA